MANLLFPVAVAAAFYALIVRPQQQRQRSQRALVASIDVGDDVVTVGGILGTVAAVHDERLELNVAPGVNLTFMRSAIANRVPTPGADARDDLDPQHGDDS